MRNKDKSLLEENTIRRFMKLAAIEPLTETFVSSIQEDEGDLEEPIEEAHEPGSMKWKPLEEREDLEDEEFAPEELEDVDAELEDEDLEDEDLEEPVGDVDVESLVSAIADAIESETGVEVSVEGEELPPEDEELPPDEELADMAEPGPEDLRPEEFEDEEFPPEEEALQERFNDMVNEVARRVAARLLK